MDTIFDHLDREWPTLANRRHSTAALQGWAAARPALRREPNLDALVCHINRRQDPARSDRTLAALIAIAAHDSLAARTALQAMLPGLKAVAATLQRFEQLDEIAATLTATCWQRIRRYPIDRRPTKVALNLLYDTRHHTVRQLRPLLSAEPLPDLSDRSHLDGGHPATDLLVLLRDAVHGGVISADEATLIGATRMADLTFPALAKETGLAEATLRQRRLRAEHRLARGAA